MTEIVLNLFYAEPETDRWFRFDRYPRRAIRRVIRGKPRIGGQRRVFLNLRKGLDRLNVKYRVNDYRHVRRNPQELACIVGKPFMLDKFAWKNPILFGSAVYNHPTDDPGLMNRMPVRKVLVPGEWMRVMCEPYWGEAVTAWPVGIDTDTWQPEDGSRKAVDVLLYDKVLWDHHHHESALIGPIREALRKDNRTFLELRYGFYREERFYEALRRCRSMIFLCEHETQGIAYQQALACDVPILAWDRKGPWVDPAYYPDRVKFEPVTSVPYWDERCGRTFADIAEFPDAWGAFWEESNSRRFRPREYILENLTLEECASKYVAIARSVLSD